MANFGLLMPFIAFGFIGAVVLAHGFIESVRWHMAVGTLMIFSYPITHVWLPELIKMF